MTDVRTLLHDLAAEAPRAHGEETADRVVEAHRAQDRRRLRMAGVAVAIAVVVAAVPALVTRSSPADTAAVASVDGVSGPDSLFDVPTRGSLAGDAAVVAAALAASWDDGIPYNDDGRILDPVPQDRHVAFVGEVPGGQVWALVVGRTGNQLAYAWFADVDPADGMDLLLVGSPSRAVAGMPAALIDVVGDVGAMVVVALPGQEVEPVAFGDQDPRPDVRSMQQTADGVAMALVGTATSLPGYRLVEGDVVVSTYRPEAFDSSEPLDPFQLYAPEALGIGTDAESGPEVASCMVLFGWAVTSDADGTLDYGVPLSATQLSMFQSALEACRVEAAAASAAAAGDGD